MNLYISELNASFDDVYFPEYVHLYVNLNRR